MLTMITFEGSMFTALTSSDGPMNHTHYHYQGKWALVTEPSSGIGRAFAYELAARAADLIFGPRGPKAISSCAQYNR
jgi:NADP-dependent 3-hydroxy acid dehydrogenase YdfG